MVFSWGKAAAAAAADAAAAGCRCRWNTAPAVGGHVRARAANNSLWKATVFLFAAFPSQGSRIPPTQIYLLQYTCNTLPPPRDSPSLRITRTPTSNFRPDPFASETYIVHRCTRVPSTYPPPLYEI